MDIIEFGATPFGDDSDDENGPIVDKIVANWAHERLARRVTALAHAVSEYLGADHIDWILSQKSPPKAINDAINRSKNHVPRDYYSAEENNTLRILNMTSYTTVLALYESAYSRPILVQAVAEQMATTAADIAEMEKQMEARRDDESND